VGACKPFPVSNYVKVIFYNYYVQNTNEYIQMMTMAME